MYEENIFNHNWLIKKLVNDKVRSRLPDLTGLVLDLGCGERPFERDILQHADAYIGVDWALTTHSLMADVLADLNGPLPFGDGTIDHVVSFEVLEHLSEPGTMLREAARVLKRGGGLTLSLPFQWWVHEAPWDFQRFTRHGLLYQLERAGFIDVEVRETSGFWSMWVLKLNYQLARLTQGSGWQRRLLRVVFVPLWWLDQHLAFALDRKWKEPRETAGYFVTAQKP